MVYKEDATKVIEWWLIIQFNLDLTFDLVGILINTNVKSKRHRKKWWEAGFQNQYIEQFISWKELVITVKILVQ